MSRYGKRGDYGFAELPELESKFLEVPYQDGEVSLYVLLPNAVEGEKKICSVLSKILKKISRKARFRISSRSKKMFSPWCPEDLEF